MRERAEAGREPGSSGLRLPKYWDNKHAPPRLASLFYFETGSHEVTEGLTKEREGERERERELRLAANLDPPVSASQSTGITSVRHHARPNYSFKFFEIGLTLWQPMA